MATYKGIQGYSVQKLSSDPTASEAVGQLWYNSVGGKFKIGTSGTGAWASGGAVNTSRSEPGGAGTQTAGLIFAGEPPNTGKTEKYDGTSWTELNDLTTVRFAPGGGGTQTAAMCFGGQPTPSVTTSSETWDGTSWSEGADILTARGRAAASQSGTPSAMLFFGGTTNSIVKYDLTETWNGTSWTETADLNEGRFYLGGVGTSTAALAIGGDPALDVTETWNGTSWTEVADLNTGRGQVAGAGSTTAALAFGGLPAGTVKTEKWDGTSWTEVGDLALARWESAGIGTSAVALSAAGNPTPSPNSCEEWNDPVYTIKTVTVS